MRSGCKNYDISAIFIGVLEACNEAPDRRRQPKKHSGGVTKYVKN